MMTTSPADLASLGLGQPDQIGFVVRDLDLAMQRYAPLFGPFQQAEFNDYKVSYRGAEPSAYRARFAFGRAGALEIELIEWIEGDTPHRDFLEQGHEGMHHLRYRVGNVDDWLPRMAALGYAPVWANRASPEYAFAYYERPGDPLVIELLEAPDTGQPGH
jgi:hypothetical protein